MRIDPADLSNEELREHVARLEAERDRTTAGWHHTEVDAWAACRDVLCPEGGEQHPVRAIRSTNVVTFGQNGDPQGPYANTISHSHTYLRFADPDDAACPCGLADRDLSEQKRPVYPSIMGGQDALLRVRKAGIAENATAESVLAAAAAAKTEPESPVEQLQRRYVSGEIEDDEYARKLAAIGHPVPALLRPAPKPKPKPVEPEPKAA